MVKNLKLGINQFTEVLFFLMLLSPILGYIYTMVLSFPKDINKVFLFIVFFYGIYFTVVKNNLRIPLFAIFFLLFALYRMAWNIEIVTEKDINLITKGYYYIRDFAIFFMLIVVYNSSFSEQFINRSLKIFKATLLIAAFVIIIQVFSYSFLNPITYLDFNYINEYTYRRKSIFGFVDIASIGYDFLPIMAILLSIISKNKSKWLLPVLALGGIIAFLSNNRYIIIDYLFLFTILFIYFRQHIPRIVIVLFICVTIFYYFFHYIEYNFEEWYYTRLFAEGDIKYTTRYQALGNFVKFFPQNPLLGTGEQTKEIVYASRLVGSSHIHVGYLSHLVNYGIIGCLFLYGSWLLLLKRLFTTAKMTHYWGSFFAFCCFLIGFSTHSESSIFFYGLIFSFIFDKYFRDRIELKSIRRF